VTAAAHTETSVVDRNHALGRQFFEEQDRLRGGPAEALCAPGYTATLGGNPSMDRSGHEAFARGFYAGFPAAMHEIDEVIATADRVVVRFTIRATHNGNFFGIPPTGKPITVRANAVMHVVAGKVTKLFGIFDEAGLLRQIGVLS
jgi:predicted ester cyclase